MSFFPAFNKGIFFLGTSNALKPLKAIFFHGCWPSSGNFPNCQALKEFCQEKMGIPTFVSACGVGKTSGLVPYSMAMGAAGSLAGAASGAWQAAKLFATWPESKALLLKSPINYPPRPPDCTRVLTLHVCPFQIEKAKGQRLKVKYYYN